MKRLHCSFCLCSAFAATSRGQSADEMAKQLSNPIASLTSVPLQFNDEHGVGLAGDGGRSRLNIQPVVPVSIGSDWNLISRTIVPIMTQKDVLPEGSRQSGVGDVLQSLFFSPKAPTRTGWVWGVGPVLLFPTATHERLGMSRFGAGPTAVALRQSGGGWTYRALANHVLSLGGDEDHQDVNATFFQPFVSKRIGRGRTLSANLESTYDWEADSWIGPVNVGVSQVLLLAGQLTSFQGGVAWFAKAPEGAPEWGLRFTVTFLFPRR